MGSVASPAWASSPLLPCSPLAAVFLFGFLASTPVACTAVYLRGGDRVWWGVWNSCAFSVSYCLLYLCPLCGLGSGGSWPVRLALAQRHWVVWLSCFTELVFQPAHNLFVRQLHEARGTVLEWPFFAYGLSDGRWSEYRHGSADVGANVGADVGAHVGGTLQGSDGSGAPSYGLAPEVVLINWNDAVLGLLVFVALLRELYQRQQQPAPPSASVTAVATAAATATATATAPVSTATAAAAKSTVIGRAAASSSEPYELGSTVSLVLLVVFRDATLWRETVEYMWDHHRLGYPHTTVRGAQ